MVWQKFSDRARESRKVRRASPDAIVLWWAVGNWCSEHGTDGVIPPDEITDAWRPVGHAFDHGAAAKECLERGLLEVVDGGYYVHDFLKFNPSREDLADDSRSNAKRQALWRDRQRTIDAIIARDGWNCAYCLTRSRKKELQIDHVIALSAGGSNGLANLVLACKVCNASKCDLSVDEWIESGRPGVPPRSKLKRWLRNPLREKLPNKVENLLGDSLTISTRNGVPTRPDPSRSPLTEDSSLPSQPDTSQAPDTGVSEIRLGPHNYAWIGFEWFQDYLGEPAPHKKSWLTQYEFIGARPEVEREAVRGHALATEWCCKQRGLKRGPTLLAHVVRYWDEYVSGDRNYVGVREPANTRPPRIGQVRTPEEYETAAADNDPYLDEDQEAS